MELEELKINFEKVALEYGKKLCDLWEISEGYWAGDEKGGLYCFLDTESINYDDMVYIVNNSIPLCTYFEWSDYNARAHKFGFNFINLKSWVMGCPRVSEDLFEKLEDLSEEMTELIKKEKEKL